MEDARHKSLIRSFIRFLGESMDGRATMGTYAESSFHEETHGSSRPTMSRRLAFIAVFSAVIAVTTMISIPLPKPVFEITLAPAVYLALAVLVDRWDAFSATAIGSFIGELFNITVRGGLPVYPFGMIWARAPEVLIVAWAAKKGRRTLAIAMVAATIYETFAFLISDWLFYTFGLFGYGSPAGVYAGLGLALPDLATLADLAFIPIAFALIAAAGPTVERLGYRS
jgi:uncharacterized membrane protein